MRKIFGVRRRRRLARWLPVAALGALVVAQGVFALPGDRSSAGRADWRFSVSQDFSDTPRTGSDKDCRDFATHDEAQAFYEENGLDDPHRLDGDDDGIACERLR
jgi:hypothetical protein